MDPLFAGLETALQPHLAPYAKMLEQWVMSYNHDIPADKLWQMSPERHVFEFVLVFGFFSLVLLFTIFFVKKPKYNEGVGHHIGHITWYCCKPNCCNQNIRCMLTLQYLKHKV
eukprot:TRINITY_DN2006_c0_g1_i6.p1 TRINITY_DN2006_c0_g1~~TRINITY_DN2006_c0_g1_i6.p1  ORF type:complete len:113 (-),score=12.85 TRINITY_DN2006_c0_g1_i6:8-346(-)